MASKRTSAYCKPHSTCSVRTPCMHSVNGSFSTVKHTFNAEGGYEVHVLVDGVSSQRFSDRAVALQRLVQSGAFLTTSEMTLFQLMVGTHHPAFRTISGLCKEERPAALPEAKL